MIKVCAVILLMLAAGCDRSPQARRNQYLAKGKTFLQKQSYSRAVLEFKNAAQVAPADAEVYYQLGIAYSGMQDFRSAVMSFRKSVDLDPKHTMAQLRYSQLASMTNDKDMIEDARNRLKALLQRSSGNAEMLNALAFTDLKLGNAADAERTLEQALAQSPGEVGAALLLAQTKLSQKNPQAAEAVLKKACQDAPKVADLPRYLGELYIAQQKMPEAEKQLRAALQIDPKSGPALMDLARLQLTTGQKGEAEQSFKRLSSFPGYESMYALFLWDDGRKDEAIREFQKLYQQNPSNRTARTRLVAAYWSANRPPDAKRVLQDALKKNPRDNDALLQRGEIYLAEHQFNDAEDDFNRVLKAMPSAPEIHYLLAKLSQARGNLLTYRQELSSALQLNPDLLPVRLELAQTLIESKEGSTAMGLFNEAPESQKKALSLVIQRNWALWSLGDMAEMRKGIDQGLAQGRSIDLLIQDGLWKLRANNPAGARAALEEALKIDPSDLRALQGLHQTYVAQKDTAGALKAVKEYAARQPKSAPVQDFLGLLLLANDNHTEARTAFTTAKAADPHFVTADLSLVQMDASEGKTDDARRRLEAILKDDGTNLTAMRWLGNLEEVRGNHDAAIEQFRKVVAEDPNDAQAANNLAYLLVEYRNEHDVALKLAQKAVDMDPNAPEYCDTLGWVLYRKGVYNSAIQYFQRASANPQNVVWKYHLAMAYAKAGDIQHGKATLDAAFRINANVPEAKIARELLHVAQ